MTFFLFGVWRVSELVKLLNQTWEEPCKFWWCRLHASVMMMFISGISFYICLIKITLHHFLVRCWKRVQHGINFISHLLFFCHNFTGDKLYSHLQLFIWSLLLWSLIHTETRIISCFWKRRKCACGKCSAVTIWYTVYWGGEIVWTRKSSNKAKVNDGVSSECGRGMLPSSEPATVLDWYILYTVTFTLCKVWCHNLIA